MRIFSLSAFDDFRKVRFELNWKQQPENKMRGQQYQQVNAKLVIKLRGERPQNKIRYVE